MNLFVWNFPESSTEQQVREFLEHELGHYAKRVTVQDAGTPKAYATVDLASDGSYVGEVIAQQLQGKIFAGARLQASPELFGGGEPRPA
ncbi:RNA-binding protein [Paraburkholderia sp. DHOC27]|uniref:RNA recognition motif domain-containing protein n=1 Tax=Paraburkholderia sp. DHOC27 TaxID=2303330 RepID=UPI000E3E52D1|nr:RNA-binding protein [Paraburkholderia sp. DHOC27]RFU44860.1 RNA-binding protein [Paraburkholderia sp. DHOC27]